MHSLLVRQLRKFKPGDAALDLDGLAEAVSQAYASFDADRAQIEHSLETMSRELGTRNRQMAEQLEQKQQMMNELTRANAELRELNSKFETAQSQLLQSEKWLPSVNWRRAWRMKSIIRLPSSIPIWVRWNAMRKA